jgi:REP element-mobilizing transposase RayT
LGGLFGRPWFSWCDIMVQSGSRKSPRLTGFDYSREGAYFITICVNNRHEALGEISVGAGSTRPFVELTKYGKAVEANLVALPEKFPHISVGNFVIMPNHIHCILHLDRRAPSFGEGRVDPALEAGRVDPAPTLSQIVGYFKYQTTKEIGISGFWQRSYYDHVIRDAADYHRIYEYIEANPLKWTEDRYYTIAHDT